MKSYLENWFKNKMLTYKNYLDENAVYCNDRSISQIGGWTKTGSIAATSASKIVFNTGRTSEDLSCNKNIDKFSVRNIDARFNYPIGLATVPELKIIDNAILRNTGQIYWLGSPQ